MSSVHGCHEVTDVHGIKGSPENAESPKPAHERSVATTRPRHGSSSSRVVLGPRAAGPRERALAAAYAGAVRTKSDSAQEALFDNTTPATPTPVPEGGWHPASWHTRPAAHQPPWPDPVARAEVLAQLAALPPLVFAGEARAGQ